jgi:predicted DNA-binding transcriptional regulator YafY
VTERPDGTLDVALTVSEPAWLDRLLLRLGSEAEVIDPPALRAAGAAVARRVLARYTEEPAGDSGARGQRSGTSASERA